MSWLEEQHSETLKSWLRRTHAPMIATLPNGTILWVNQAFEQLVGYTMPELIGERTWMSLVDNQDDLAADVKLSEEAMAGDRVSFYMQKSYRAKNGDLRRVVVDKMRHPAYGDFQCFLETAMPVDRGIEFAMGELSVIRTMLMALAEKPDCGGGGGLKWSDIKAFYKETPVPAYLATLLISLLLFGNRVIELWDLVRDSSGK